MGKSLQILDGVEIQVETGIGTITSLESGKRNVEIKFDAQHAKLQYPPRAYLDTHNRALHQTAEKAREEGARVAYRIVVKRKPGQPTDVPLAEIVPATSTRIRDLDGLKILNDDGIGPDGGFPDGWDKVGTPASEAGSPPAGEVRTAPSPAATQAPPAEDPGDPGPTAPEGDTGQQGGAPAAAAARSRDGKRGPRIEEAKPWEPYNTDGSLNLGSYAVQAVEGVVLLAHDLLLAQARFVAKSEGQPMAEPSRKQVKALARRLLEAADGIQAGVRSDGHFDRMDTSHTRSRAAMRASLDAHPVPWGATGEEQTEWVAQVVAYGTGLMGTVLELVDPTRYAS